MEAHKIAIAVCGAAIATFGTFVTYTLQHDSRVNAQAKVAQQLSEARNLLESAEARKALTIGRLKSIKDYYRESSEAAKKMDTQIESVGDEIKTMEGLLAEAKKELAKVEKEINQAVEFQRAAAVGSTYPRIELSNGKILLNAKLVKFSPQNLEFAHAAGKTAVRWSTLPKEFVDRFRLGADEGIDDTVIEDSDVADDAQVAAAAKAAERRRLLQGRLRTVRYDAWRKPWNVDARSVGSGERAFEYLSRYIQKTALDAARIDKVTEQGVTIRWIDRESDQPRTAALSGEAFLHRFLQHVLPRGFVRVRHFGYLSAAARGSYQRLRALLRAAAVRLVLPDKPLHCCAACGSNAMQFLLVLRPHHSRAPPTCLA